MPGDQYRSLAADYHWFFDDVDLQLGCDTPGVRAAIAGLEPGSRVLDAACGIGVDAAALLRRGLDVAAADASEEMVEQARNRLREFGGDGPGRVVASAWTNLPAHFELGIFDAVFCVGNSIAHAAGEAEMVAAFEAMRSVLAPGGILVLDSHDWAIVHDAGNRMTIEPRVVDRDDIRCIRTYTWCLADDFGDPCVLDIVPIFLDGERASLRSYRVQMQPFTRAELKERLATAGFEAIALDAIPGDDRYTATARRPCGGA